MDVSDLTLGIVSIIITIVDSFGLFIYSQYYKSQKFRREVIKVVFDKAKIEFKKGKIVSLTKITDDVKLIDLALQLIFFIAFWRITIYFLQITHAYVIYEVFLLYYVAYYVLLFPAIFHAVFMVIRMIRVIMNLKILSYRLYVFIESLSQTTSDWILGLGLFLFFASLTYLMAFKLNTAYLLSAIVRIAIYSIVLIYLPITFLFLNTIIDFKIYKDLESLIFDDVQKSAKIKVWTESGDYEGEVKEIDNINVLVISSVDNESKKYTKYIPWERIQAFEVIDQ